MYRAVLLDHTRRDYWNRFVERSNEGTLFHRLDFLEYHGERFAGCEHPLTFLKGSEIHAVLPLAIIEEGGRRVAKSPYGASYGGPVAAEPLRFHEAHELLDALLEYLRAEQVDELELRLPVRACQRDGSETFRLALDQRGLRLRERIICSLRPLESGVPLESTLRPRARRMARKAEQAGVQVAFHAPLADFWSVMESTFTRHGTPPTHSFEEYAWLNTRFPDRVYANVAYLADTPVAGIGCVAVNERVLCGFYLCHTAEGRDSQALTLLVCRTLEAAQAQGYRWFDFGTTGRRQGFEFKENFGTTGMMRETYHARLCELSLAPWDSLFRRAA